MIGDNFDKDIIGANNLKIKAIWLNHEKKSDNNFKNSYFKIVYNFNQILELV